MICFRLVSLLHCLLFLFFFFFNDTATTEIYTLSLHDALPISPPRKRSAPWTSRPLTAPSTRDRKSTRLNSSHVRISYAVFCLKKKKKKHTSQFQMRKKKTKETQNTQNKL